MIKRLTIGIVLLLATSRTAAPEPQIPAPAGNVITLTTGVAVRLVPNPSTANPLKCNSMLLVPLPGAVSGNVIWVLNAPVSITMVKDGAGTTTVAPMAAATATAPGQSFTFPSNGTATSSSSGFDLRLWGLQGTTGDTVAATCDLRN